MIINHQSVFLSVFNELLTKGDLIYHCICEQTRIKRRIRKFWTFHIIEFSLENVFLVISSSTWWSSSFLFINDKNEQHSQRWHEKRQRHNHAQISPGNLSTREKNSVSDKIILILTPFAILRTSKILLPSLKASCRCSSRSSETRRSLYRQLLIVRTVFVPVRTSCDDALAQDSRCDD